MNISRTLLTVLMVCIIPLTACAQKYHQTDYGTAPSNQIFFSVDKEGRLVAISPKGERIPLKPVSFPVDSKKILSVDQITIIQAQGSHFYIACSAYGCGRVDLPAPHPPQ